MSILLLSLLLIFLVGMGLMMHKSQQEYFENMSEEIIPDSQSLTLQPDQLMQLEELIEPKPYSLFNYDDMPEEEDIEDEDEPVPCPKCPDMSQYVKLEEVPCWNCALP